MDTSIGSDFDSLVTGSPVEPTPRWIRVKFARRTVADSKRALLHIQYGPGRLPTYYFPPTDVDLGAKTFQPGETAPDGKAYQSLQVGSRTVERAVWLYKEPPPELMDLKGYISFAWDQMDGWFEEEEQVFVHARDPYKRVDVIPSSRRIRVEAGGTVVAESDRPFLLFETNLPTRYYLPPEDVRMGKLIASDFHSQCPYKGIASYWSLEGDAPGLKNVVWSYPDPIPENPKIKDLMCFFNERVDIYENDVLQPRPQSPWS